MKESDFLPNQNYQITFGKFRGKALEEIDLIKLDDYLGWLETLNNPGFAAAEAKGKIAEYLDHWQVAQQLELELENKTGKY